MPDVYLDGPGCYVTSRVSAGYRNGVDATGTAACAFGTQPDVVFVYELPVWRSVAVTRPVNRLVARDVCNLTYDAGTRVCGRVVDRDITHLVILREEERRVRRKSTDCRRRRIHCGRGRLRIVARNVVHDITRSRCRIADYCATSRTGVDLHDHLEAGRLSTGY